jgi:hypothetical protein
MTAAAVPESMITWSGTRHKVGDWNVRGWYVPPCNHDYHLEPSDQRTRPHKRDCKRCFPPAEDFGSDTLTDLERARSVAVALEQELAELQQRVDEVLTLCGKAEPHVLGSGCHAPFAVGGGLVDADRVRSLLAGDAS